MAVSSIISFVLENRVYATMTAMNLMVNCSVNEFYWINEDLLVCVFIYRN